MIPRLITIAGIGPGSPDLCTLQIMDAVKQADILIGARRMLNTFSSFHKPEFVSFSPKDIFHFTEQHSEYKHIVILVAGDTGFYSNAKGIAAAFSSDGDYRVEKKSFSTSICNTCNTNDTALTYSTKYEIRFLCGISSVTAFCARLKISWEDTCLLSIHGRRQNLIYYIARNKKTISLLSKKEDIIFLCNKLVSYGMDSVILHLGKDLSYPEEQIIHSTAKTLVDNPQKLQDGLWILLAENPIFSDNLQLPVLQNPLPDYPPVVNKATINNQENRDNFFLPDTERYQYLLSRHIPDHAWIRQTAKPLIPMTKEDIRLLSITKLGLTENAVLYDIGAGTGTIGIEASLTSPDIQVFSIEQKECACELIQKNRLRFAADNVTVISGTAPAALAQLPPPSHAFIGGSSGNLAEIIRKLLEKNPSVRIVINAISLETIATATDIINTFPVCDVDITQIQAVHTKKIGSYHMMDSENPVTIFSFTGAGQWS